MTQKITIVAYNRDEDVPVTEDEIRGALIHLDLSDTEVTIEED